MHCLSNMMKNLCMKEFYKEGLLLIYQQLQMVPIAGLVFVNHLVAFLYVEVTFFIYRGHFWMIFKHCALQFFNEMILFVRLHPILALRRRSKGSSSLLFRFDLGARDVSPSAALSLASRFTNYKFVLSFKAFTIPLRE